MEKEIANVRIAFRFLKRVTPDQIIEVKVKLGFIHVRTHMIFYINMDGKFTCNASLVEDGHKTAPPLSITYSSVVTRESARLSFLITGLV